MAQVITEVNAKGSMDFWHGKTPCWEMTGCPESVREACPVAGNQSLPCWEIEGTYVKLDDRGACGQDVSLCAECPVYKKWGEGACIRVRLFGQGIDTSLSAIKA